MNADRGEPSVPGFLLPPSLFCLLCVSVPLGFNSSVVQFIGASAMTASRYVVGIDLGTTNCSLSYVDTGAGEEVEVRPLQLAIPQVVQTGVVEERLLLPSFLYLPGSSELPAGSLKLPWDPTRDYAVGEFARQQGSLVPTRLVTSAKSWLCHPGVDRRAPILPHKAPEGVRKVSPLAASTMYLRHLTEAWNARMAGDRPE